MSVKQSQAKTAAESDHVISRIECRRPRLETAIASAEKVLVRWARLSALALYLALAMIPPLVLRPEHSSPAVEPVATYPETFTSGPSATSASDKSAP